MNAQSKTTGVERAADPANHTRKRRVALRPANPAEIASVAPDSLGEELGIRPGDRLLRVNGHGLRDVIDFAFYADVEAVTLEVERDGAITEYEVERDLDEPWGIDFSDPTFDGIHVCDNSCPFCFIKQIPKGMRRSLYVMDDDYRYSMLYGSFVTLTNLTEDDWARIEEQRLGPLYVSVHATNPDLRSQLVGSPKGARILDDLLRLEEIGIDYHAQLVLNPGINDGTELDRSLQDLDSIGSHLQSIAAVPVGLTQFGMERQSKRIRESRPCVRSLPGSSLHVRRYEVDEARNVVRQCKRWQDYFRQRRGKTFVYLGDEFYLMTGESIPPTYQYDEFGQVEDGIGITRLLLDDAERLRDRGSKAAQQARGWIACGTLIGPTMECLVAGVNWSLGTEIYVRPIRNEFFGDMINVSGLLTGSELLREFEGEPGDDPLFISEHMISRRTNTMLDDMRLEDLQSALRREIIVASNLSDVVESFERRAPRAA